MSLTQVSDREACPSSLVGFALSLRANVGHNWICKSEETEGTLVLSDSLSSVHPLLLWPKDVVLDLAVKPLWLWSQGCCLGLGCQTDVAVVLGPDVGYRTMWQLGICFVVVVPI